MVQGIESTVKIGIAHAMVWSPSHDPSEHQDGHNPFVILLLGQDCCLTYYLGKTQPS